MLDNAFEIKRVVLATGRVDLRKGVLGLAAIIGADYDKNPYEKGTLFLFCGNRSDRIKGLLWIGTGFVLLYIRLEDGSFSWPRDSKEAAEITEEQFKLLMLGINPLKPKVKEVYPTAVI
ncbi:MAG: IS66 family insertion sequence element accessory protein TnpB [Lachnospiraceae bacterium]|nr:IS66 family insertion sequence element accessory protein TnpB [Lachnospiraceae bacterium]